MSKGKEFFQKLLQLAIENKEKIKPVVVRVVESVKEFEGRRGKRIRELEKEVDELQTGLVSVNKLVEQLAEKACLECDHLTDEEKATLASDTE